MREILFRGKAKDGYKWIEKGEWIEGSLLCYDYENGTVCQIATSYLLRNKDEPVTVIAYEVDPETVCQYTGLIDKNGRKIFEGDILEIETENLTKKDGYFIAEWSEPGSCFVLCGESYLAHFDRAYKDRREVIGNIFDNPELVGGKS